uniref:GCN5-like N-acetyltransferase n=1 Tax=Gelidium gabrielsonii TaxID=2483892 RepID=A0A3G2QXK0_9FLOR|nr:GCN5-like N-acetyltransferase [Gelidium gabrielsonii]AYO27716.1 GCN5-like N-acetyltransferase [Gelidium gabrielsonii]
MTFWNFFFSNPQDTNLNNAAIGKSSIENNLLIKHFEKDGKVLDIYLQTGRNINLYELEQLCDSVGWVRRPINKVKIAIEHSFLTISLFYKECNRQKLIGFARATSDTAFNATIWDVVIHPDFQGCGLGKILMDQIVKELRYYDISTITLFADPQVVSFYRNIGFITDPDGVKGMFWYPL